MNSEVAANQRADAFLSPLAPAHPWEYGRLPSGSEVQNIVQMFYHLVDLVSLPPSAEPAMSNPVVPRVIEDAYDQIEEFMDSAVYYRCDRAPLRGREIGEFYRSERRLVGRHVLTHLHEKDSTVVVTGMFVRLCETEVNFSATGIFIEESEESIRFCDIWHFHDDGTVSSRETYLGVGAELIENRGKA